MQSITLKSDSKAKFYIYRNLTKNCFSVKHKGKVIAHCNNFYALNATTKVNQATRARVVHLKHKLVHAYIVAESVEMDLDSIVAMDSLQLKYDPYKNKSFELDSKSTEGRKFKMILGTQGRVYSSLYDHTQACSS